MTSGRQSRLKHERQATDAGTVVVLDGGSPSFPHRVSERDGLDARRATIDLPPFADDIPLLQLGDIVPFGPDRHDHPLTRWPDRL